MSEPFKGEPFEISFQMTCKINSWQVIIWSCTSLLIT